jgi:repressor LexA
MIKLTARQEQILELIRDAITNTGFPPTRAEIANELGFRSANAAEEHLQALARKGAIEISPGTSRGIRLLDRPADGSVRRFSPGQMTLPHPELMQYSLPLIGRVAAGSPILAQEHISATYQVDPSLFTAKPDYLLQVRGMSMRDAGILDGDLLAVKKTDSARDGQIVVARLDDEVTVKRFRKVGGIMLIDGARSSQRPFMAVRRQFDDPLVQQAADWLALRKAKRLPLTPTAWDDTKAEGAKVLIGGERAHHRALAPVAVAAAAEHRDQMAAGVAAQGGEHGFQRVGPDGVEELVDVVAREAGLGLAAQLQEAPQAQLDHGGGAVEEAAVGRARMADGETIAGEGRGEPPPGRNAQA